MTQRLLSLIGLPSPAFCVGGRGACLIVVLIPLIFMTGCVTTEELGKTQWEVNTLKTDVMDLKEKSPASQQKIEKRLQDIESNQESTSRSVSDLFVQMQSLTTEFRILTGRFEESRYYSEKLSSETKGERENLTARLKELEAAVDELKKSIAQPAKAEASQKTEDVTSTDKKPAQEAKKSGEGEAVKPPQEAVKEPVTEKKVDDTAPAKPDVKDVYMAAYQAFKEGKTTQARERFTALLTDYPDNDYSDNSRFWIAESYYKDKAYEDAILAYEELIKKNPKSDKIPGALLKQGLSFYELKDDKTGRIILEKLVEQYPDSEQAKAAKSKLGKTAPPKKK